MKLNLIVIRTQQLEQQAKFYEKLGIKFQYHKHGNSPYHYSADLDGTIFEIYPTKNEKSVDRSTRLGFQVKNLNKLIENLEIDKSESIIKHPEQTTWGYSALVKDLDGRKIELIQQLKRYS